MRTLGKSGGVLVLPSMWESPSRISHLPEGSRAVRETAWSTRSRATPYRQRTSSRRDAAAPGTRADCVSGCWI